MAMEKAKALEMALSQIEKDFGKGAIMRLGDAASKISVSTIPSGCLELDFALGVGGIPRGRIIEIYGPESSGKTTIALHIIAEAQKLGGTAAFIDAEHALDPVYAENLGVDVDELYVSQPDTGDMGDSHVGLQARLMSQALRKMTGIISKSNTILVFINQLREKVGVMFGNPETTTGGRALKFYASIRLDVRRIDSIKNGSEVVGNRTRIKVVKNKVAPPFKTAEFDIIYGEGISKESSVLDLAIANKIISKSGAWYYYGDMRMAQGRDNARLFLKDNSELCDEIEAKLRKALSAAPSEASDDMEGGDDAQD